MKSFILYLIAIATAPLLAAIILKVKAFFGGKKGPPLLINYFTLAKLVRKGSVYSTSTTFLFATGPVVTLAVCLVALMFLPMAGRPPLISFAGDALMVVYLFGLARFFTIAAAMDTASPFEGMGAAREAYFPIICEATVLVSLVLFCLLSGQLRLAAFLAADQPLGMWQAAGAPLAFAVMALFVVMLTENCRVPVDDPATHLELTMIHEVMVLDHSGPDFAFIEMARFLKLFFYAGLVTRLLVPMAPTAFIIDLVVYLAAVAVVYAAAGVTESVMARYRMDKVPKFVLTSLALALFATVITLEFIR